MRKPHVLKPNERTSLPRRFLFFDTETFTKDDSSYTYHILRLGVARYVELKKDLTVKTDKWYTFEWVHEFWSILDRHLQKKSPLWIVAHNIDFDASVVKLYKYMEEQGFVVTKWFVQDRGLYLKAKRGDETIVLHDSLLIFPVSLRELGKHIGIEKLEMPDWNAGKIEWETYCWRDVEVLSEAYLRYLRFLKENDLGNFQPTIAGQAFSAFRHRFMDTEIYIHGNEDLDRFEEESYYGGRTEAWFIGRFNDQVYDLDVNSMYPYVMKQFEYPTRFVGEIYNPSIEMLQKMTKKFLVIARVRVKTELPIVPYRSEKVIFPVGTWWGTYATPEIRLLLRYGAIEKVDRVAVYRGEKIFKSYVDFFYEMKKDAKVKGDRTSYLMSKLFLNSLYGKFGQRTKELVPAGEDEISPDEAKEEIITTDGRRIKYIVFMGKVWNVKDRAPSENSFIAIASHVTSYARVHLWKLIERAGMENVLYMDTDSLFVTEEGYKRLKKWIDDEKLGYLKLERAGEGIEIRGAKNYTFCGETKIKGIPKRAKKIGEKTWEFEQFMRFRTKLRKGLLNEQVTRVMTRTLRTEYDKGQVLPSGRVIPLVVVES